MFPSLFPFEIGVLEMENKLIKVYLQIHMKHLMNLNETLQFFKTPFIPIFCVQHNSMKINMSWS
jgi:hypothetical protein